MVSRKYYSDLYYGDFFDYTREKLGKDRLIMSRPVDGLGRPGVLFFVVFSFIDNLSFTDLISYFLTSVLGGWSSLGG